MASSLVYSGGVWTCILWWGCCHCWCWSWTQSFSLINIVWTRVGNDLTINHVSYVFSLLATPHGFWGLRSLTGDRVPALGSESAVLPLDCQGIPMWVKFFEKRVDWYASGFVKFQLNCVTTICWLQKSIRLIEFKFKAIVHFMDCVLCIFYINLSNSYQVVCDQEMLLKVNIYLCLHYVKISQADFWMKHNCSMHVHRDSSSKKYNYRETQCFPSLLNYSTFYFNM